MKKKTRLPKKGVVIISGRGEPTLKLARTMFGKSGEKFTEAEMRKMGFVKKKKKK